MIHHQSEITSLRKYIGMQIKSCSLKLFHQKDNKNIWSLIDDSKLNKSLIALMIKGEEEVNNSFKNMQLLNKEIKKIRYQMILTLKNSQSDNPQT